MQAQDDLGSSLAPYPSPPAYLWQEFTQEKTARLAAAREAYATQTSSKPTAATVVANADADLEFCSLLHYQQLSDRLPSLEEQGVQRLAAPTAATASEKEAHAQKVFELRKTAKSLLLNFLELAGILGANPHDAADKLEDLQTIFYNMYHYINEWRPHQTREALITMLQTHLETTRNETQALREATDSVRNVLAELGALKLPDEEKKAEGEKGAEKDEKDETTKKEQDETKAPVKPEPGTGTTTAKTEANKPSDNRADAQVWETMDELFG